MLTIGMAVVDDFDGVYFTVQALRMYHPEVTRQAEFIVVDNKPDSKSSPHLETFLANVGGRYIAMPEEGGTSQPRNRVFKEAKGDLVLCMDSHVLIAPNALKRLLAWYAANPTSHDLISGPMLYDNYHTLNTHFDDVWRAEMWGIWGQAYKHPNGTLFTAYKNRDEQTTYHALSMGMAPIDRDSLGLPPCHYDHRNQVLQAAGCISLGHTDSADAFPIPGMGLGLFTCRKDAWLGFNPNFRGFGGEEMYIHEKFRQAGHQALCLPFLKWGHRFARPQGLGYTPYTWYKLRNYIIGLQELGLPLDRCYEHFVGPNSHKKLPQPGWDYLLADPINRLNPPGVDLEKPLPASIAKEMDKRVPGHRLPQPGTTVASPREFLDWAKTQPRDLDKHLDKLSELAAQCGHATELAHRRESTIALLAAEHVNSYNAEIDPVLTRLVDLFPARLDLTNFKLDGPLPDIQDTDLLFLDTIGTAPRLYSELQKYHSQVSRYIVVHDTQLYRDRGEDSTPQRPTPGLLHALRQFMTEHPEWSVIYHTHEQYGLTVIGKLDKDKPQLPSTIEMASNFAAAMAKHVADGLRTVSNEEYKARLEICTPCPQRRNNNCAVCGCNLSSKASLRTSECPLGFWSASPREGAAA